MYSKKIGIFIGRFQPLHFGHIEIIEKAKKEFDELVVIIGSDNSTVSLRNPFSTKMRRKMLESADVKPENILSIRDSYYDFDWWVKTIRSIVWNWRSKKKIKAKESEISLIGHYKDSGSFWLDAFPNWKLFDVGKLKNDIHATDVRDGFFTIIENTINHISEYSVTWREMVSPEVYDIMMDWKSFTHLDGWKNLNKELQFVKSYQKSWQNTPYPVIFTTADALVKCNNYILLIKRGKRPGKGLYALPGGFVEQNETLLVGALRELYEETNIKLKENYLESMLKQVKVFDEPKRDERGRFITHCHYFDCCMTKIGELPEIKYGDDASEAVWFPIEKLNEISNQFYADHFRIIMNMLGKIKYEH